MSTNIYEWPSSLISGWRLCGALLLHALPIPAAIGLMALPFWGEQCVPQRGGLWCLSLLTGTGRMVTPATHVPSLILDRPSASFLWLLAYLLIGQMIWGQGYWLVPASRQRASKALSMGILVNATTAVAIFILGGFLYMASDGLFAEGKWLLVLFLLGIICWGIANVLAVAVIWYRTWLLAKRYPESGQGNLARGERCNHGVP